MLSKLPDGSIIDSSGKIVFLSTERFIHDIVDGNCCFICGAHKTSKDFNEEHIIPQWVLRKFNLHHKLITLPNKIGFKYDRYKIPCCVECNTEMAKVFEIPMSNLFSQPQSGRAVSDYLKNESPWLILGWLTLLFFKVHYKDKSLRYILDRRQDSPNISDFYDWSTLHHLHCVCRAFHTQCLLEKSIFGTLFVLPALTDDFNQEFDFLALYEPQSILIKLGDIAFIAVLNDSGAAFSSWSHNLSKINGPLSQLQLRETLACVSSINLQLQVRPKFKSNLNLRTGEYSISAEHPEIVEIDESLTNRYGELLYYCCQDHIQLIEEISGKNIEEDLRNGRWTFLFDQHNNFINHSIRKDS